MIAGATMREGEGRQGAAVPRRQILRSAAGLAVVLAASGLAIGRTRGYALPAGRTPVWMSAWQWVVVEQAARRIAAADVETAAGRQVPTADDLDVVGFFDGWVARMPERVRRDLGRFLAYLEHLAPLAAGHASRFSRLGPADQDRVLESLEQSRHDLLRAGFEGLKSLVFIGYYRDARTWPIVGYDGPLVGRPPGGWR
jgi:hypothetical protein